MGQHRRKKLSQKGDYIIFPGIYFDHGGEMQIQSIPYFALTITFQKKESKNEESIDRRGSEDAS